MQEKKQKKILYVITRGSPWGGAQAYVYDLVCGLDRRIFDTAIAIGHDATPTDLEQALGSQPHTDLVRLTHLRRAISPIHDLLAVFELKKIYQTTMPDVIHLNSSKASIVGTLAAMLIKKTRRPKIMYTVHGWVFEESISSAKKWLYRILECSTSTYKDRIIVLSQQDKLKGEKIGIRTPQTVIPLGVKLPQDALPRGEAREILNKQNKKTQVPKDAYWIGTIANLYKTKDIGTLIDAFRLFSTQLPQAHLWIIGEGPEKVMLEKRIERYTLNDRVHLVGFIPRASRFLSAFDVFVLSSQKEGLPYSILEAQIAGIPVIGTDVGGVRSIIEDKKTGLLVPSTDSGRLCEAFHYAFTHTDAMEAMAHTAQGHANKTYTTEHMLERTIRLYRMLLNPPL